MVAYNTNTHEAEEDCKFKTSLGYTVRLCLKKIINRIGRKKKLGKIF
jgi:hypothetical protein